MTTTLEDRVTVVHVTGPKLAPVPNGLPEITPPYVQVHTVWTDMPAGLTDRERTAYVRGYSRGCMTYAKKHAAPIGPDTPQEERTAIRLDHEENRHPVAHRAGLSELRKWFKLYGTEERAAEILPKPARAKRTAHSVEVIETVSDVVHAAFTRVYGAVTDTGPLCANEDRAHVLSEIETPDGVTCGRCVEILERVRATAPETVETPETVTPAPVVEKPKRKRAPKTAPDTTPAPMPRMTYGAARQSRRELAASRRAAGLSLSGPDWIAAKVAAGIVDGDTRETLAGAA